MKKFINLRVVNMAIVTTLALLLNSCKEENLFVPTLSVDTESVSVNRLGWMATGARAKVEINSNVYWNLVIDEQYNWISTDIMGGSGKSVVTISAEPNDGADREGYIIVETIEGEKQTITVLQSAAGIQINFCQLNFDAKPATMIPVNSFRNFTITGVGSTRANISGAGTYFDNTNTSEGYPDASAGNYILFAEEDSHFMVSQIETKSLQDFVLSFGSTALDNNDFNTDGLLLQLSIDSFNWLDVPYSRKENSDNITPASVDQGWKKSELKFRMKQNSEYIYIRWTAVTASTFCIDDIELHEGVVGEGTVLNFDDLLNDNKPAGFVYFDDNLDWISPEMGNTVKDPKVLLPNFVGDAMAGKPQTDIRSMKWGNSAMIPANKAVLDNSGWTNILTAVPNGKMYPTEMRLQTSAVFIQGDMYANNRVSNIESPNLSRRPNNLMYPTLPAQEGITPGKKVDVVVTVSVAALDYNFHQDVFYTGKSLDYITITVQNQGTINNKEDKSSTVQIGAWNEWKELSFSVFGVTNETKILVSSHYYLPGVPVYVPNPSSWVSNAETQSKFIPNCLFLNSLKVTKAEASIE